jgi:hypothetical protein
MYVDKQPQVKLSVARYEFLGCFLITDAAYMRFPHWLFLGQFDCPVPAILAAYGGRGYFSGCDYVDGEGVIAYPVALVECTVKRAYSFSASP